MPKQIVHLIAAARPNFMKVAPLWHALAGSGDFAPVLVHTGQHYDANMSAAFLADLKLPEPDFHLGIGSGSLECILLERGWHVASLDPSAKSLNLWPDRSTKIASVVNAPWLIEAS